MRRSCIVGPLVRSGTIPTSLGGNHKVLWIGEQCLSNQLFIDMRPIRICGIDEVDAKFHSTLQDRDRPLSIFWRTPNPLPGKAHGSKAETANRKFTAQGDIPRPLCRDR